MACHEEPALAITGTTRLYGIMGHPIAHSLSPVMQTFAFRYHQLDCVYVPFPVDPVRLAQAVSGAMALGICGFNVTIPHKETIMPYLDEVSAEARAIGAVNTVHVRDGRSVGYNTDGEGFLRPLRALKMSFTDTPVCLLGAGGAARAVAMALLGVDCAQLTIANRTQVRAERLVADLARHFPAAQLRVIAWQEVSGVAAESGLLINATSVGLHAAGEAFVSETALHPHQVVYDLVYRPLYTPLLEAARSRGAIPVPGLDMLIGQGEVAFGIWTGLPFPVDAVRRLLQPFFETAHARES